MTVHKPSTPLFSESSRLLRSLAADFQRDRNVTSLARLLMAISDHHETDGQLDELASYLEDTASDSIQSDWAAGLPSRAYLPPVS